MKQKLSIMKSGYSGRIVEINGDNGLIQKLDALGIREGNKITKISEQLMRGPITIRHNNTQLSLGFKMASKIMVETN